MNRTTTALLAGILPVLAFGHCAHAQPAQADDPTVQVLLEKGILTQAEAEKIEAEIAARRTNMVNELAEPDASQWKISDAIKSIQLFGDVRLRYEYRGVDNLPGDSPDTYYRERFRYSLRVGVRGDLSDDFSYGIRFETGSWSRSPWDTFGNNTTAGSVSPSDKATSGMYIGQLYLGWHPADWYEMTVGRMAMPLYTTPMIWSASLNPEGAFEKFKYTVGNADLFADFGQFDYQDPTSASGAPSSDLFMLAWQLGAKVHLNQDMFFELAPVLYDYTGSGTGPNGLNVPFVGQGDGGVNVGIPGQSAANIAGYDETGINDLLVLEVPAEFDFKIKHTLLGPLQARFFGDFAYNFQGDSRARAAYYANPAAFPGVNGPVTGQNISYQIGFGIGSDGPVYGPTQGIVYGTTAKKHAWEARTYWQHTEQYSVDPNLLDADFFEGTANLQGVYVAFAYSFTDAIIGTVRYGYANRINDSLGTGSSDLDIPNINPIKNYNVVQLDLAWRF